MSSLAASETPDTPIDSQKLKDCFELQRQSFLQSDSESYQQRKDHLLNLKRMITAVPPPLVGNRIRRQMI